MSGISVLLIKPSCGKYGNKVFISKNDWYGKITYEIREQIKKQVVMGDYLSEDPAGRIYFEVKNEDLGDVVTLLVTGEL